MAQALLLRQSLHGLGGLAGSSALRSLSMGHFVPHVQAAGGQLVREPYSGRARLSIHGGRKGKRAFHPSSSRPTGYPAQVQAL